MAASTGELWSKIVHWDNFLHAAHLAAKGKRYRDTTLGFFSRLDHNISRLIADVENERLDVGSYDCFVVYDPKRRVIHAPSFRDRVLHHAILNFCEPAFEKRMIFHSYACRQGKGQHAAVAQAVKLASQYPYFLKMDIRRFFDSIDHKIVKEQIRRQFREPKLRQLFDGIVDSYQTKAGKGLPIGALTSQFLANSYLNPLDRFIKERMRQRGYVRYMDDFVVWDHSTKRLKLLLNETQDFLCNRLGLEFTPQPYIQHTKVGMDFLGFRVFPGWIELTNRSKQRFKKKMKRMLSNPHRYSERELQQRLESLSQFAMFARSWHYRRNVIKQYEVET